MFGSEGSGVANPQNPLGLNLEQAMELGKGNAIHQLQQNYQALSAEVTQMSNELREVLAHLKSDPGGHVRRNRVPLRGDPLSSQTYSSQDDEPPRRERRPPREPMDDLRDMKFNPSEFEGNLNPDLFIEWMQALERFFEIKEYSDEKAFKVTVLKLEKYASLWCENVKKQRAREGR